MREVLEAMGRSWPWWAAGLLLVAYELWAVAHHKRTLSQMVWRDSARYRPLPLIMMAGFAVLAIHFWVYRPVWFLLVGLAAAIGLPMLVHHVGSSRRRPMKLFFSFIKGAGGSIMRKILGKAKGEPVWVGAVASVVATLLASYGLELSEGQIAGLISLVITLVAYFTRQRTVAFDPTTGTTVKPIPTGILRPQPFPRAGGR